MFASILGIISRVVRVVGKVIVPFSGFVALSRLIPTVVRVV